MEPNMIGAYGPWAAGLLGEGPARLSFRQDRFRPGSIDEWRRQARHRLRECLLQPDTGKVPEAQVQHQLNYDGLHVEHLTGSSRMDRRPRPSSSSRPGRRGRLPAVIGLHDHGGNKYFGCAQDRPDERSAPPDDEIPPRGLLRG